MNFIQRFKRNWITSASHLNLIDQFSVYKHQISALKDTPQHAKLYEQLTELSRDFEKAVEEEETQKGWKIFKEIRRLFVFTMTKEEYTSKAHIILREAEVKTKANKWRIQAIKDILGIGTDGHTFRDDLSATHVVKAMEILDEHQDNFYENLETLKRRIRLLSWITFISLFCWVLIGPEISQFPLQKDLKKDDVADQYKAILAKLDSQNQNPTEKVPDGKQDANAPAGSETPGGTTNAENPNAKPKANAPAGSETPGGTENAENPDAKPKANPPAGSETSGGTANAENTPPAPVVDASKGTDPKTSTQANPVAATKEEKKAPAKCESCNDKKDAQIRESKGFSGIHDIPSKPRWLAILVIITGIIGAVVSGFVRTIQPDADGNIPDQLFGSTLLAARLMLASVAALAVYIFLGTGIVLVFGAQISFELLLAFSFVAGFSEQLVQRGVDSLSKQAPNDKSGK